MPLFEEIKRANLHYKGAALAVCGWFIAMAGLGLEWVGSVKMQLLIYFGNLMVIVGMLMAGAYWLRRLGRRSREKSDLAPGKQPWE